MATWSSRVRTWLLGAALGGFSLGAQATLIGDSVDVCHYFPDTSTAFECFGTTVASDSSDVVTLLNYFTGGGYAVDMDASSFLVDFLVSSTFTGASFNGLFLDDLDVGGVIAGLLIETNMAGWDDSMASFDADSVWMNWSNLSFDENTYFRVTLLTREIPTPAPLLLLAAGLLALRRMRR